MNNLKYIFTKQSLISHKSKIYQLRTYSTSLSGKKCLAYGVTGSTGLLEPMQIHRRHLTDEDVNIDIHYCGICHSDLHWMRNEWKDSRYPMVPGHEIIGKISSVGSNVTKFKPGDKVGVGLYVDSCRQCTMCTTNRGQHCSQSVFVFNSRYKRDNNEITKGGFSKSIVVDQNYVNTIPDSLDMSRAAPLMCAGVTVFTPMRKWQVGPGCKFAVNGLGGLGHMAVKLGVALGADVTVLSHSEKKREDARRLGANDFVLTSDRSQVSKLQNRFDCILNTVTVAHDLNQVLGLIKTDGVLILVGIPEKPLSLQAQSIVVASRCMTGSLIGSVDDLQRVIDYCALKNIHPDVEIISMKEVNDAMERMLASKVRYRFVIDMATL